MGLSKNLTTGFYCREGESGLDLLKQFEGFIIREKLICRGDSLILGVSGGPDSMTMMDLFSHVKDKYVLEIVIFHLNHMFRRGAEEEALFVKNKARDYGFKVVIEDFDVPEYIKEESLSPEEGAREIRFNLLAKWAEKFDIKKVAMAHNKDDLVETVFLNLIRGTGLKGLTGIDPVSENYGLTVIHPILGISRKNIEYYCREKGLKPRVDPTNKETVYTRNKIRNLILPQIEEEINSNVKDVIYRMADNIREEENFLQKYSNVHFQDCIISIDEKKIVLSLPKLQREELSIRRRIIKNAVQEFKGNVTDLYSVHYQAVEKLIISGETGKTIQLKDDYLVRTSYNKLIFERDNGLKGDLNFSYKLTIPGKVETNDFILSTEFINMDIQWRKAAIKKNNCICDFQKIESPLIVRNRQEGDYFIPFGMNGSKKVKDFFIDEKVPVKKRDQIPIIVDNNGEIIWIAGYRADERFRVDNETKKLVKLGIIFTGGD